MQILSNILRQCQFQAGYYRLPFILLSDNYALMIDVITVV